ncbi:MAG: hypothetical protein CBC24_02870 [Candidatus Pelagibacter sp. TMED64]|nr:hypothetical protein [Candidatus Pelagibacter sp.]OUU66680.1 MAG: hypothetical protein CBC24_02870 [Candidatus Pelagibacter sp. TMED64]|tara:strand:+ start:7207 stop:7815 length:609 start_codon:yes stop_codon:yes gene_type:complete
MVRSISNNYTASEGGYPIQLIAIQPDSDIKNALHLNTSSKRLEFYYDSNYRTFYPGAGVLNLTAVEETKDVKTNQITIELNGVPNTIIPVLKNYNGIGGIVTIWQGWMNDDSDSVNESTDYPYTGVYIKWKGVIYSHSVNEENQEFGKIKISLECKNILGTILDSTNGRFTSDSSFKKTSAGDRSMEFVSAMATFNPKFGQE